ncbi:uncharacterized protein F4812DRAFT_458139 [Daldinia caldariorum]|uniref:uncharacterized protein n=1 Tax=Daldinia caldariorum TaxID=326644 RepID=UPI0020075AE8|nr:uncharacterized protein F4812DRAFT_458139 [Daldinia caldariorum]KAI1468610.1 hypothetical protein F4812DRAFT_458139 [Daldinia caldariorum]
MANDKENNPTPVGPSRRRSSGPTFDSLMSQKRTSDPDSLARRASLHEQKPQAGFFGKMWHKFLFLEGTCQVPNREANKTVAQISPGSDAFPIESGAFGTVRANPQKSVRRETRPAQPRVLHLPTAICCGGINLFLPTKTFSHASGYGFALIPRGDQGSMRKRQRYRRGKGSPRPSPRCWLRSKVASAEVR